MQKYTLNKADLLLLAKLCGPFLPLRFENLLLLEWLMSLREPICMLIQVGGRCWGSGWCWLAVYNHFSNLLNPTCLEESQEYRPCSEFLAQHSIVIWTSYWARCFSLTIKVNNRSILDMTFQRDCNGWLCLTTQLLYFSHVVSSDSKSSSVLTTVNPLSTVSPGVWAKSFDLQSSNWALLPMPCDLRWKSREAHSASLLSELTVHSATTKQLYSPR